MDPRTIADIAREQRATKERTARPQTGIVTDDSPLTIDTGSATIVQPYKLKGWTPTIGNAVLVLRWQNALVAIPIEAS